jgi:hypothetical protein
LLFNITLEYDIRDVQENQVGVKLNGTYQPPVYADDVNLLGDNIDTMKKNTETFTYPNKEVGLEVKAEKTKYTLLSRHQNAGQNHNIKIVSRYFENVARLKYIGMRVTDRFRRKIKRRLISGNAYYYSVHNLLSSRLLRLYS